MTKLACVLVVLATTVTPAQAKDPNCAGADNWPAASAFGAMKNAHLVINDEIDFNRTAVTRISSEKIGKDLWRQVHLVRYYRKSGPAIEAITVSDASQEECSMGDVQTFIVSKKL
jgi:hypothetical protein